MRFVIDSKALSGVLARVGKTVPRKPVMEILSGVKIVAADDGAVTFYASRIDMDVVVTVQGCDVLERGACLVPHAELVRFASRANGACKLSSDAANLECSAGSLRAKIAGLRVEDFPCRAQVSGDSVKLDLGLLLRVVNMVSYAVSEDAAREYLGGVQVSSVDGKLDCRATDCSRLAVAATPFDAPAFSVLLPVDAIQSIAAAMPGATEVEMVVGPKSVVITGPDASLSASVIDAQLPKFTSDMLRFDKNGVIGSAQEFRSVIRYLGGMDSRFNRVDIRFGGSGSVLSSRAPGGTSESTEECATVTCERDVAVAYNGMFIHEAISVMSGEVPFMVTDSTMTFEYEHEGIWSLHVVAATLT